MDKNFLWAPWRMDYINNPNKGENIFLEKSNSNNDRENLVLYRGKFSFILMNLYPYNNGHLMIAPYKVYNDLIDLDSETFLEITKLTQQSISILKNKLNHQGINFGLNMGEAAGAGVRDGVLRAEAHGAVYADVLRAAGAERVHAVLAVRGAGVVAQMIVGKCV